MLICALLISCTSPSQENDYSSDRLTKLKEAFAKKDEEQFLKNFPNSFSDFKNAFGWNEATDSPAPLSAEANQYINYWFSLIGKSTYKKYEKQLISISKGGQWEADAVNVFKDNSLSYIKQNKRYYLINSLDNAEAESVLSFLFNSPHTKYDTVFISNLSRPNQQIVKDMFSAHLSPEKKRSSYKTYERNDNYFIRTFDVNKDGIPDKIVSSKPYKGEDLFVFYGDREINYVLSLETTNFSEDGGNIIQDITPVLNNAGLKVTTSFPDRGYYEKEYYIEPDNHSWILKKIIYKTMSDVSENAVKYICEVAQNIDITKSGWKSKIKPIPEENNRSKKCKIETANESAERQYSVQDADGYTNLRKEKNSLSEIIQQVKSGENIEVLDNSGEWYRVATKEGNRGYIHKSRITRE